MVNLEGKCNWIGCEVARLGCLMWNKGQMYAMIEAQIFAQCRSYMRMLLIKGWFEKL